MNSSGWLLPSKIENPYLYDVRVYNAENRRRMNSKHTLTLQSADNGWIVTYGCVTLVLSVQEAQREITNFLAKPEEVVAYYRKKYRPSDNLLQAVYGERAAVNAPNTLISREGLAARVYVDETAKSPEQPF
jgi:hypothetical protein